MKLMWIYMLVCTGKNCVHTYEMFESPLLSRFILSRSEFDLSNNSVSGCDPMTRPNKIKNWFIILKKPDNLIYIASIRPKSSIYMDACVLYISYLKTFEVGNSLKYFKKVGSGSKKINPDIDPDTVIFTYFSYLFLGWRRNGSLQTVGWEKEENPSRYSVEPVRAGSLQCWGNSDLSYSWSVFRARICD